MTTIVKVITTEHPAQVTRVNPDTGNLILAPEKVPPHANLQFTVHDRQAVMVVELPPEPTPMAANEPTLEAAA